MSIKIILRESKKLLLEVKLEDVKKRFRSKRFLRVFNEEYMRNDEKNYPGDEPYASHEDFITDISTVMLEVIPHSIHESAQAEALQWLISQAILVKEYDFRGTFFKKDIENFYKIKNKRSEFLEENSLNNIVALAHLRDIIEVALPKYLNWIREKAELSTKGNGVNLIHRGAVWEVFIPETRGAAIRLGAGTNWCTAARPGARNENLYDHYHSEEAPLYIFINRKDPAEKYQFAYIHDEFMDRANEDCRNTSKFCVMNEIIKGLGPRMITSLNLAEAKKQKYKKIGKDYYLIEKEKGKIAYVNKHGYHNEDGPAVVSYYGAVKEWYQNGKLHRKDGPAYTQRKPKIEIWFQNDMKHREDGPAIISSSGPEEWYLKNKRHRKDGPAFSTDTKEIWFLHGEKHRVGGPALTVHKELVSMSKILRAFYQNGKLHNDDGPAEVYYTGEKRWYKNGNLHNENGPARIASNGVSTYYLDGERVPAPNEDPARFKILKKYLGFEKPPERDDPRRRLRWLNEAQLPAKEPIDQDDHPLFPEEANRNILRHNVKFIFHELKNSKHAVRTGLPLINDMFFFGMPDGLYDQLRDIHYEIADIETSDPYFHEKRESLRKEYSKKCFKTVFNTVVQTPPLNSSKIVKHLGSGANGVAYELASGRVLKIGRSEYGKDSGLARMTFGDEEDEYFKNVSISKNFMPVFAAGKYKEPVGGNISWREIPFFNMLTNTDKKHWSILKKLMDILINRQFDVLNYKPIQIINLAKHFKIPINSSLETSEGMIRAMLKALEVYGDLRDAHIDNVGTLVQDPSTYVIFDN